MNDRDVIINEFWLNTPEDVIKEDEYNRFLEKMAKFEKREINWKPYYPNKDMEWMYGSYSGLYISFEVYDK